MVDKKIKNNPYSDESQKNARLVSEWYDRVVSGVEKCPFCDLREKYIVKSTKTSVLTMNTFPYIDGHLMVIPKRHVEKFADLSTNEWLETKDLVEVGMNVLREENSLNYNNINVLYREGDKNSGSSLKHLHIHILPITPAFMKYEKVRFIWTFQKIKYAPRELAKKLRALVKDKKE